MYEELVERLLKRIALTTAGSPLQDDLLEATDAIENTSRAYQMMAEAYEAEVTKQDWIPVTERLPKEERRTYWCYTDTGYQCEVRWTNDVYGLGAVDKWDWKVFDYPRFSKITHWMPLPEPPEKE